jgi:hypothetical protein
VLVNAQYTVLDQNQASNAYNPSAVRDRIAPIATRSRKISAGNEVEAAPSPDLVAKIDNDALEASTALGLQKKSNEALRGLVSEAASDGIPPADFDLDQAVAQRVERQQKERLRILADEEAARREKTDAQIREVAKKKQEEQGQVEAARRQAFEQRPDAQKLNEQLLAVRGPGRAGE